MSPLLFEVLFYIYSVSVMLASLFFFLKYNWIKDDVKDRTIGRRQRENRKMPVQWRRKNWRWTWVNELMLLSVALLCCVLPLLNSVMSYFLLKKLGKSLMRYSN